MTRSRLPMTGLRAFEASARHLNIRRAAEELSVTAGAVSQQIQQLEAWIGEPLIERRGRGIALTAKGRQLGERLAPLFAQFERVVLECRTPATSNSLRLRLSPTLAIRWLVPNLAEFIGRHPEIEVEVNTTAIPDENSLGDFDLAVRIRESPPANEDWIKLFSDAFTPVCSPTIAASLRKPEDLENYPRLHSIIRPDSWSIWCRYAGFDTDTQAGPKFANAALAYQAAADGLGVAIGQLAYIQHDLRTGRLVAPFGIVAHSPSSYYLVWAKHKSALPKISLFRDWCQGLASRQSSFSG